MPATVKVSWRSDTVGRFRSRILMPRMRNAAQALARDIQAELDVPYPPASRPGEPPRRRTGVLRRSVRATVLMAGKRIVATWFSTVRYAPFVRHGTRFMAPRPFGVLTPARKRKFVSAMRGP